MKKILTTIVLCFVCFAGFSQSNNNNAYVVYDAKNFSLEMQQRVNDYKAGKLSINDFTQFLQKEYKDAKILEGVGWGIFGLGLGTFASSFAFWGEPAFVPICASSCAIFCASLVPAYLGEKKKKNVKIAAALTGITIIF